MRRLKSLSFILSAFLSLSLAASAFAGASGYHLLRKVALGGAPSWDYMTFDAVNHRLYLAHGNQADILDGTTGKLLGTVLGTQGIHEACPVVDAGVGYTSDGGANTSTRFDLRTLKVLGQVPTGQDPDAIGYDAATGCVYVCDGKSQDATVIQAATGAVVATIPLGGKPEFLASDDKGMLYISLEDTDGVAMINTHTHKLMKTLALPKGSAPSSMAIDKTNGKLFIGCRNKTLVILDTRSGDVVQSLPIGGYVDETVFDSATGAIFSSCGDGTLSVIHQDSPSAYTVVENIKTVPGAHSMAMNPDNHELFVPALENKVLTLLIFGQ